KFGKKNEKENQDITSTKRKAIEKISLPEIVLNTIPNLVYLNLRDKSNSTIESTEQRFPDEITNWLEFEQEVRTWQPEADKKYPKPTCEKDIWSATDMNIFDALTPLDQSISFLDGRALKNIIGEPDFIIVDDHIKLLMPWESKTKWVLNVLPDQNIVTLYNEEKEFREGTYAYSNDTS
ncbi:3000_t:CDS:2, partial [Racocetra persica]